MRPRVIYISYSKEEACIEYHPTSGEDTKNQALNEMLTTSVADAESEVIWYQKSGVRSGRLPEAL